MEIYKSITPTEQKTICCWISDKPYSWNVCALEISSDSLLGDDMLSIIPDCERQRKLK